MYINAINKLGIRAYEPETETSTVSTEITSSKIKESGLTQAGSTKDIRENAGDTGAGMFTKVEVTSGIAVSTEKKQEIQNPLQSLCSQMTEEDYQDLKEEGTSIEEYDSDRLEKALERIKKGKELRQKSVDSQIETKKEKRHNNEQAAVSECASNGLDSYFAEVLSGANMPVTEENITRIKEAMDLLSASSSMTDASYQYIIGNEMAVTPDAVYKAVYSGMGAGGQKAELEESVMNELLTSIEQMLEAEGKAADEKSLNDAKWLLKNALPVTTENIEKKQFLEQLKEEVDIKNAVSSLVKALKDGIAPTTADLMEGDSHKMESLLADISEMDAKTVRVAVYRQKMQLESESIKSELTMQDLREAQAESEDAIQLAMEQIAEDDVNVITAKRQLEEIRLKLTMESAQKMKEMGIAPDTAELSKMVEGLRELEDRYYQSMMEEVNGRSGDSSLLKETIGTISGLKTVPAAVLGATLEARKTITVAELSVAGEGMKAAYEKVESAYEPLMTAPRSDLGDSITKAFQNVDSILEDMGQEINESNQRAVRILAYNQIELTEENITEMKAYDTMVNSLISNMKPAVTASMIKEGINPLSMSIEELNEKAKEIIKEQGITAEEKFSEYLVNLESKKEITPEERSSYIGIYRLLHQVQKSDGAAIGAVVKAGQEVTLNTLLTAVRSEKKQNQDFQIDDDFGMAVKTEANGESISAQINSAYDTQTKTDYMKQILDKAINRMTPENTEKMVKEYEAYGEVSLETLIDSMDVPKDDHLTAYEEMKFEEMKEFSKNHDEEIAFLRQYQAADTIENRKAAQILLQDPSFLLNSLEKMQQSEEQADYKEAESLLDSMESRESFMATAEEFLENIKSKVEDQYCMEAIEQADAVMLQNTLKVLKLSNTLAKNGYFNIPVVSGDTVTNINLTILHDQDERGRISITLKDASESKVALDLTVTKEDVKCFVTTENEATGRQLSALSEEFKQVFKEAGFETKSLFFTSIGMGNDNNLRNGMKAESKELDAVSTDALYQLSKQTIQMLMKQI